ncbi:MAG: Holliday junction resolvase RuvX [Lawsonibacter sp.]
MTGTTTTIHSRSADVVLSELARLAKEQGAEEIVMGFPRNMDGTEGPRAELYRA